MINEEKLLVAMRTSVNLWGPHKWSSITFYKTSNFCWKLPLNEHSAETIGTKNFWEMGGKGSFRHIIPTLLIIIKISLRPSSFHLTQVVPVLDMIGSARWMHIKRTDKMFLIKQHFKNITSLPKSDWTVVAY